MNATMRRTDELLDAALEMTFPASDPIAVDPPVSARRAAAGATRRPRKRKPAAERGRTDAPGMRRA